MTRTLTARPSPWLLERSIKSNRGSSPRCRLPMATARPEAHTRDRLIEAARHLFWERGYGAASVSDILARAGANSGSFYHFFDSKESLLRVVLETYLEGLEPVIVGPARRSASTPVDRVFAVLAGYRERLISTQCGYGCPLGRLALEIEPENRPAHALIAQNFAAWRDAIRSFLDQDPSLPKDLDRDGLAAMVLSIMEGGVMQSRASGSPEPFDRSVAQLRDYFNRLRAARARVPSRKSRSSPPTRRRSRS
jgi:TetR/AcrR family transcriptional repressor of nem operon